MDRSYKLSYQPANGVPSTVVLEFLAGAPRQYTGSGSDPNKALVDALRQFTGKDTPDPTVTTRPIGDEGVSFAIARVGESAGRSRHTDSVLAELEAIADATFRYHGHPVQDLVYLRGNGSHTTLARSRPRGTRYHDHHGV